MNHPVNRLTRRATLLTVPASFLVTAVVPRSEGLRDLPINRMHTGIIEYHVMRVLPYAQAAALGSSRSE